MGRRTHSVNRPKGRGGCDSGKHEKDRQWSRRRQFAMAAGVTDKLWSVGDIVDLIEAAEALEDGSLLVG